ncbi:hypothetical protein Glove_277g30 [Diversispora epigaea]|uniref:Zinc-ribbon domain-containing protein n=1 Tax=Diversispora epigaea TaxID=1348612 RepID=A0A397I8X6_9GLOM|nr:hypothetical protein Glove_277g30 [Diversispora epigaea]
MRHKLTITDARNIALEKNGECLSKIYINNKTPLRWKCNKYHKWNASLCDIKRGTWCPKCYRPKLNINIAKEIAFKKGGICLSEEYKNSYTSLSWKCRKNHIWQAPLERIKNQNSWCPKCAGSGGIRLSLQIAKNIAQSRNGECLSDKYINIQSPLQWKCHQKHIWFSSLNTIKNRNTWYSYCAGYLKLSIDIAKEIAHHKGGKCLSENYISIDSKLLWECNKGHQWYTNLKCVRNFNTWCLYCSGRYSCNLELAKKVANKKGGDCISEKYINSITPLLWQCAKNHIWYANLDKVKNSDTWCPFCLWKREELCKNIVTKLLGSPSDIRKPDFLKTSDHPLGLELDIYYSQYGFAIEVQGIQHERFHTFFHKDQEVFKKQFARDQLKKELCDENWIVLIEVWYYEDPHTVISQKLQELGLIP